MPTLDTSSEAAAVQLEAQRRLGVAGRFRVATEMSEFTRELARSGLRTRRADLDGAELRRELVRLLYGLEVPTP